MRPMQWINLLRLAADPKVTRVPVRVLAALRREGKRRLPEKVAYDKPRFTATPYQNYL